MFRLQVRNVLLVCLLCVSICRADYYSAVTSLSDLWEAETFMLHRFEKYMMDEEAKNTQLQDFLAGIDMELAEANGNALGYYGNPMKALKAIKRLARDWNSYFQYSLKLTNEDAYNEDLKVLDKVEFKRPVYDDLLGAAKGIARLQHIYKLDTSQFANGTVMGRKISAEMLASDCFHLGASLSHAEDFKHALTWLLEARARLGQEMPYKSASANPQFPKLDDEIILEYLVPSTVRAGNIKLGYWLAREQLEKNASNEKALESLQYTQQKLLENRVASVQQITSSYENQMQIVAEDQDQVKKAQAKGDREKRKEYIVSMNEEAAFDDMYDEDPEVAALLDAMELETDEEERIEEIKREEFELKAEEDKFNKRNIEIGFELIDDKKVTDGDQKPAEIKNLRGKDGKLLSLDALYGLTCRGDMKPSPASQRVLRCKYAHNNVPFCLLARFKVEEVNLDPYMAIYYDVIYEKEIAKILEHGEAYVQRSKVGNDADESIVSDVRTSKNTWLWRHEHKFLRPVNQRLKDITGLNLETAEALQVANYGIGGHYGPHYDFAEDEQYDYNGMGNRVLTALFYVNNVEMGGGTAFPYLGLVVPPVRGSLVMWYNLHASMHLDYRTKHAACPVLLGSKWICNEWFHIVGQEFHRPCGLKQEGYKSIKYKQIELI